jgi:hypothetical protein
MHISLESSILDLDPDPTKRIRIPDPQHGICQQEQIYRLAMLFTFIQIHTGLYRYLHTVLYTDTQT